MMVNRIIENIWNAGIITGVIWLFSGLWFFGVVCITSLVLTIFLPLPDSHFKE